VVVVYGETPLGVVVVEEFRYRSCPCATGPAIITE